MRKKLNTLAAVTALVLLSGCCCWKRSSDEHVSVTDGGDYSQPRAEAGTEATPPAASRK